MHRHLIIKNAGVILLFAGVMLLFDFVNALGQDCASKFEAAAGPDIDVCQYGVVNLYGTIGGEASRGVWEGGRGTFTPGRNSVEVHYEPSPAEFGTDVTLTLVADNPRVNCPGARSKVVIRVNSHPEADAGPDQQRVCAKERVELHGTFTGRARMVNWTTNGSGSFDDPHKADAVYTPSQKDITSGACSLEFTAYPFGVCDSSSDVLILEIEPVADIETDSDVYAPAGAAVKLIAKVYTVYDRIWWETDGTGKFENSENIQTKYISSGGDISRKTILLRVNASRGACTVRKQLTLHIGGQAGVEKN